MSPEPESEFYGREIGVIEKELTKRGADTIIAFTRFDSERETQLFRELAYGLRADGIILWGAGRDIANPDQIPFIAITASKPQNADNVRRNMEEGMEELAKTLKAYGHKEIGFIGERFTLHKEEILKKAMRRIGLPVHDKYFFCSEARFAEAGKQGMEELIKRNAVPTVVVAAYDQIAYGAMQAARNAGYRIPEDVSFVGIDNISVTPYFEIPLSSLETDFEAVCPQIIDLLFKRIENRYYRAKEEIVAPVKLNLRESLQNRNL
jgi:DNA-binding LacI/PurR family transcriptional regulator